MPNWCFNRIEISGPTDEMDKLLGSENREVYEKFFETHAPLPCPEWDYSIAVQNWSTKWDIDLNIQSMEWSPTSFCVAEGYFETAWAPATNAWKTIAAKFPKLKFIINFLEEGMCFYGYDIYDGGELVDEMGDDIPEPAGCNDNDIYESLYTWFDEFVEQTRFGHNIKSIRILGK